MPSTLVVCCHTGCVWANCLLTASPSVHTLGPPRHPQYHQRHVQHCGHKKGRGQVVLSVFLATLPPSSPSSRVSRPGGTCCLVFIEVLPTWRVWLSGAAHSSLAAPVQPPFFSFFFSSLETKPLCVGAGQEASQPFSLSLTDPCYLSSLALFSHSALVYLSSVSSSGRGWNSWQSGVRCQQGWKDGRKTFLASNFISSLKFWSCG